MAFLTQQEMVRIGFKHLGSNVKISDKASLHNPQMISVGDNSRIDDFCVLSASDQGIEIGRNVHISVYSSIVGGGRAVLEDFSGISGRTCIYTSTDDYTGRYLTNPTVPDNFRNVLTGEVHLGRHALVGAGCVILPRVFLGKGTRIAAMSLVKKGKYKDHCLYGGIPAKIIIKKDADNLEALEKEYFNE